MTYICKANETHMHVWIIIYSPLFYRGTAPVLNIPGPSPVTSSSEEEEDLEHDMEEEQEEEKEASRKRKRA
jgi:hypothetical protein